MKKILLAMLFVFVFIYNTYAGLVFESGTFEITATEPTANVDGTPLTDLKYSSLYYQFDDDEWVFIVDIPATSPAGGGAIKHTFTIDIPEGKELNMRLVGICFDSTGHESEIAYSDTIRIDTLPPGSMVF